jgi:hypothetical protein
VRRSQSRCGIILQVPSRRLTAADECADVWTPDFIDVHGGGLDPDKCA